MKAAKSRLATLFNISMDEGDFSEGEQIFGAFVFQYEVREF